MHKIRKPNDFVHIYMNELSLSVVAKSGIKSDKYHLGKLILESLKGAPDFVLQIDGGTNKSETGRSVLNRSVKCARAFQNYGLKRGDVIILMAPNHIDLCIPFYAALYLGVTVAPIDRTLNARELQETFKIDDPKIVFCQDEKIQDVKTALSEQGLDTKVITFDSRRAEDVCDFGEFIDKYAADTRIEDFVPTNFDPEVTLAMLLQTSGTTGLPKQAACTHKGFAITAPYTWIMYNKFPTPTESALVLSPFQWLSAVWHYILSPILRYTRLQSSLPSTQEHVYHLINTYRIDGGTNKSETGRSVLNRSVKCARAFQNYGLKRGDVIILMAPNHIDLCIPFYAALYLGVTVAPIDRTLNARELQETFKIDDPKIVFCQDEKIQDVKTALSEQGLDTKVITFDSRRAEDVCDFWEFIDKYAADTRIEDFVPTNFDPEVTLAMLLQTSGTTGLPKQAACTHKGFAITAPYTWIMYNKFPTPTESALVLSPFQWLSAVWHYILSPILRYTRLQSSLPSTQEHVYHLINTYRPTFLINSTTLMTTLIRPGDRDKCDFSCLEMINVGGSAVPANLISEIKKIAPQANVRNVYGLTEILMYAFVPYHDDLPHGASGQPAGCLEHRLIDVETQEDIVKPNIPGELWLRGPGVFKGYYKNHEATAEMLTEDGWIKTGDIFYRDNNWNFFFVERIKLMLKYKGHQISPVELEQVISNLPGVLDVAVTGVPDPECGDLAVACVVRRPGCDVTAVDVKRIVKESLSDAKQLRGGVIFLDALPITSTTKLHRRKLKEIANQMIRE